MYTRARKQVGYTKPRLPVQQIRWNGNGFEPFTTTPFEYSAVDPATGNTVYFDTRQEYDTWLRRHGVAA